AGAIGRSVGGPLGRAEIGRCTAGDVPLAITENVRGGQVFVIQSTCTPTHAHVAALLLLPDASTRTSALRTTAGASYSACARPSANISIIDKRRARADEGAEMESIGGGDGRGAVIVEDMVDTAGTLSAAADAVRGAGAPLVLACATPPVLSGPAIPRLAQASFDELIVTDTIPLRPEATKLGKLRVLSFAPLLGEAIRRTHEEASISSLFI